MSNEDTKLQKRNTAWFRPSARESVAIVDETRGVPYAMVNVVVSIICFVVGHKYMFFCGTTFTDHPKERSLQSVFSECKTNVYQELVSAQLGLFYMVCGLLRWKVAHAIHVVDLYSILQVLVFINGGFFLRAVFGLHQMPPQNITMTFLPLIYESYLLYIAHYSYTKREKSKKQY